MSGELASSLTGRHLSVELFPFDLDEYRLVKPEADLLEYLKDGGFPAPLGTPDADRLLSSYFNDILERDVRERVGARSSRPLRRVAVTRTGEDRGKMLECATFILLRRRFREVYYWRGKGEVDFVVLRNGDPVPVQVSWEGPTQRHREALDEFYEAEPRSAEAVFVTAESYELGLHDLRGPQSRARQDG